jgi:hypothetical protein
VKTVQFLKQGLMPFDSYSAGAISSFDDAVCDMLIKERFAKEAKPKAQGTKLIRFLRNDRVGTFGCYARNEVAGFPAGVADACVAQGFAVLHDAGNGPGVPLSNEQVGQSHGQEEFETTEAYVRRGGLVEGARDPIAFETLIAARAPKGKGVRAALGM